jgi:hypothetical protein
MFDMDRLIGILFETTDEYRKGAVLEGTAALVDALQAGEETLPGGVVDIYMMPSLSEAPVDTIKVDCHFLVVGVERMKAELHREEFRDLVKAMPDYSTLADGPSYIAVGGMLGSQSLAFRFFALGQALGFWDVITPKRMGLTGPAADQMAGNGFVMMTGPRI